MRLSYIVLADLAYKTPVGDVPLPVRKVAKVVRLVAQAEVARGEHVHLSPGKSASKLDIRCEGGSFRSPSTTDDSRMSMSSTARRRPSLL